MGRRTLRRGNEFLLIQITPSDRTKFTGYLRSSDPIASSTSTKKDYFLVSASAESVTSDGPLYVHSWLGYGLEAARQRVLEENVNGSSERGGLAHLVHVYAERALDGCSARSVSLLITV